MQIRMHFVHYLVYGDYIKIADIFVLFFLFHYLNIFAALSSVIVFIDSGEQFF